MFEAPAHGLTQGTDLQRAASSSPMDQRKRVKENFTWHYIA